MIRLTSTTGIAFTLGLALAGLWACDATQTTALQDGIAAKTCTSAPGDTALRYGCLLHEDSLRQGITFLSWFDTVMPLGDAKTDTLKAVMVYPSGCSSFDGFETRRSSDTIYLAARHFLPIPTQDLACAHGSGLDTLGLPLGDSLSAGARWITYAKGAPYRNAPTDTVTVRFGEVLYEGR